MTTDCRPYFVANLILQFENCRVHCQEVHRLFILVWVDWHAQNVVEMVSAVALFGHVFGGGMVCTVL